LNLKCDKVKVDYEIETLGPEYFETDGRVCYVEHTLILNGTDYFKTIMLKTHLGPDELFVHGEE